MSRPLCIVCGRPIAKKTDTVYFRDPVEARAAVRKPWGLEWPAQTAKPDGHREGNTVYLAQPPRNRAEAQRWVNGQIVSSRRHGDRLSSVNYWDGESYADQFFDTNECAMMQGRASAENGHRYTWKYDD